MTTDEQAVAALAAYYDDEERAFSQASVDAMKRALEAVAPDWEYTAHRSSADHVSTGPITSATYPALPATHRRRRAGAWEPVPDGEDHLATSVTLTYGAELQ